MSTTQVAAGLFQLQQLDLELDRIVAEQQAIASSLQANARLQKLRKESEIAQQQLHSGQQAQKEAEWTLEDLNRRLKAQEQRLYSGSVTTPKELQALQQEVQRLRAQHSRQEDVTLELMDATEALQETAHSRAEALQQAEEAWTQENEAKLARSEQLETRQQELQQQRAQRTTGIDAGLLQRYDVMRRTKQGRAISKVEQNSCQWCRVILTPSELQHVRSSTDLQTCTNCGRILYYERESEGQALLFASMVGDESHPQELIRKPGCSPLSRRLQRGFRISSKGPPTSTPHPWLYSFHE